MVLYVFGTPCFRWCCTYDLFCLLLPVFISSCGIGCICIHTCAKNSNVCACAAACVCVCMSHLCVTRAIHIATCRYKAVDKIAAEAQGKERYAIEVYFPLENQGYPSSGPPVLAVHTTALTPEQRLAVSVGLMRHARTLWEESEGPVLYELMDFLETDEFKDLVQNGCDVPEKLTGAVAPQGKGASQAKEDKGVPPAAFSDATEYLQRDAPTYASSSTAVQKPPKEAGIVASKGSFKAASKDTGLDSLVGAAQDTNPHAAQGACFAFQKGHCRRGDACRFSHEAGDGGVHTEGKARSTATKGLLAATKDTHKYTNHLPTEDQINKLSAELVKEFAQKRTKPAYVNMLKQRRGLPSFKMMETILSAIGAHQVIVISGATGCGKTTQIPQFILDQMILKNNGGRCSIVCTQPRRISAIGVATRVAQERAEEVGQSTGYQVMPTQRILMHLLSRVYCFP